MRLQLLVTLSMSLLAPVPAALAEPEANSTTAQEELGEATGLVESLPGESKNETSSSGPQSASGSGSAKRSCNGRGKLGLGSTWFKEATPDGATEHSFPDLYGNFSGDCTLTGTTQLFGDISGTYSGISKKNRGSLNQGGLRIRPFDSVVVAAGKERNRRAPGLIVSPSDFIHTAQNLPGTEEQRAGEWLVRSSWQKTGQTADLLLLPVDAMIENGMPAKDTKNRGTAIRYLQEFSNFDLSLSAGSIDKTKKLGISSQGFLTSFWRVYGEAGYTEEQHFLRYERRHVGSYLLGTGYDSTKYTVRFEYFENGPGLSKKEFDSLQLAVKFFRKENTTEQTSVLTGPFLRQKYVIANLSLMEIYDRFNITETLITCSDDSSWMALSRFEWLISPQNVTGATVKNFDKRDDRQYFARTYDWEATLDWKWSF